MPNSWICVDASLVIRLVVGIEDERLPVQWEQWEAAGQQLAAPALLYYEVTNAIYQYQKHDLLTPETTHQALDTALSLPVRIYGDLSLHQQALAFAHRFTLPATYDAHYLALAVRLGAEFWTADQRLASVVYPHLSWVRLFR